MQRNLPRDLAIGFPLALFLLLMAGCKPLGYEQQTRVAKDWCLAMRANQVVPVYPLTEDLQPGDVFCVNRSIDEQHKDYVKKGFLALDDHRHRLRLSASGTGQPAFPGYAAMYFDGYFKDEFGSAPHPRPDRSPLAGTPATQPVFEEIAAPRAVFPSYTFEVDRGLGLSLAVPVHGIPVGLNYMQADKAIGSMQLLDTHTFAADSYYLDDGVRAWASELSVKASLAAAVAANGGKPIYLRVITRVYLAGGVAVSLTRADSVATNLTVGNVSPIAPKTQSADAATQYTQLLDELSNRANGGAAAAGGAGAAVKSLASVGGAVQFTEASTLGVSLNEMFDHPLVIGYLGFDMAVLKDGSLGTRVPTFDVLEYLKTPDASVSLGVYTPAEKQNLVEHKAFANVASGPNGHGNALAVMSRVGVIFSMTHGLDAPADKIVDIGKRAGALAGLAPPPPDFDAQAKKLEFEFENNWDAFTSSSRSGVDNYGTFWSALHAAMLNL